MEPTFWVGPGETVVMGKVAVFDPAGIVTLAGTVAAVFALLKATVVATTAFPVRVTVPVTVAPPTTEVEESVSVVKSGGRTVSVMLFVTLRAMAEIVTTVFADTEPTVIGKVTVFVPVGTVTVAGRTPPPGRNSTG